MVLHFSTVKFLLLGDSHAVEFSIFVPLNKSGLGLGGFLIP